MLISENGSRKVSVILSLIFAGEAIFLLPFVLARIFRPTLLQVFEISNLELGTAFSVYGLVAMASYFFGGPLADKFSARTLMSFALWGTALGGLILALSPSFTVLIILYGYWGFTTIFLFWAAMIKATRLWGGDGYQGRSFGFLEGGRGFTAALIGTITLVIFAYLVGEPSDIGLIHERNSSFSMVILVTTAITALAGLVVWKFIPDTVNEDKKRPNPLSINKVLEVIKMPAVWMQGVIIICAYVGYKATDDFSLYANQVLGFNEVGAAGVGAAALWMRPLFALLAGFLADRHSGIKVINYGFVFILFSSLLIYFGFLEPLIFTTLVILTSTLIGVYGIRGIYFALMPESGVPLVATGTAVGIMSVLGFTPDVFMSPLMGYLLDTYPGSTGHQYVFLVLACFAGIGFVVSLAFKRLIDNR
ncbi:MAG: MFS transporter [Bacteroidetes bacterium]|nr:MAG: MFS transporter [Bacteroidota bacterium]